MRLAAPQSYVDVVVIVFVKIVVSICCVFCSVNYAYIDVFLSIRKVLVEPVQNRFITDSAPLPVHNYSRSNSGSDTFF